MWSHDFCTVCDKQCPSGSMYCSDTCKTSDTQVAPVTQNPAASTLYTLRPKTLVPLSPEELFLDDHKDKDALKEKPKSPAALPRTMAQSLPATTQHFGSPPTSDDDEDETYPEYNSHLMYRSPLLCATTKKVSGKKLSPPPSPLMMPSLAYNHQQMGQSVDAAGNYRRWLRS